MTKATHFPNPRGVFTVRRDEGDRDAYVAMIRWLDDHSIDYNLYFHDDPKVEVLILVDDELAITRFKRRWCSRVPRASTANVRHQRHARG